MAVSTFDASVSRESYATAVEALNAYAAATAGDAPRLAGTGDQILMVAGLLRREPRLRRALADIARPAEDRAALLQGLLSGQVGAEALRLLTVLVRGRWSHAGDLLDAVERLGVESLLAAAAHVNQLGEVEDELFRFGQVVNGDPELAAVLSDPTTDVSRRTAVVHELLEGKALAVTVRLADLALSSFGGRSFSGSLTRLVELAAARRNREVAYVTSATPLTEDEERRLADALASRYGREVSLQVDIDPAVLGGLSVRVGSDLYDGTVRRRLAQARHALTH
ncbi:MAG TPA: F0F1 ATP synthase subunit delta [Micromonosporaceae bacterium]|nr:F0F1 ATP synthase subunit delta [Micromonosporaceae bacterium]